MLVVSWCKVSRRKCNTVAAVENNTRIDCKALLLGKGKAHRRVNTSITQVSLQKNSKLFRFPCPLSPIVHPMFESQTQQQQRFSFLTIVTSLCIQELMANSLTSKAVETITATIIFPGNPQSRSPLSPSS